MAKRPHRNHNPQFKAKVPLKALKGERTMADLAERLDVYPNQIIRWKTQPLEPSSDVFGGEEPKAASVNVKALYAKLGKLTLEVNFSGGRLTKATLLGGNR